MHVGYVSIMYTVISFSQVEEVRGNEPETKNCDNLKSESEQVPEMVETWGRQFDKKERSEQKQNIVTDTGQKSTFLKSMSNKLFENSQKFMSPKPFVGKLAKKVSCFIQPISYIDGISVTHRCWILLPNLAQRM